MKKTVTVLCICLILCLSVSAYMESTEAALADGVIRLHVVANSDGSEDQQLKLKVRDRILDEFGKRISHDTEPDAVRTNIVNNLEYIKNIAEDEIRQNGYDYEADVSFGNSVFPRKEYGSITLPAGEYQALKVNIGNASGKNWWCVLFPPLCFVDEACVSVDEESNKMLEDQLGKQTYEMVASDGIDVEFRLKSYELWQKSKRMLATYIAKTR